jgi:hypothetical protein
LKSIDEVLFEMLLFYKELIVAEFSLSQDFAKGVVAITNKL